MKEEGFRDGEDVECGEAKMKRKQQNHGQLRVVNCFLLFTPSIPAPSNLPCVQLSHSNRMPVEQCSSLLSFIVLALDDDADGDDTATKSLQMNNSLRFSHRCSCIRPVDSDFSC